MQAFVYDNRDSWEKTKGLKKVEVPEPKLDEKKHPEHGEWVIVRMLRAGVCGSDKGIWFRKAFRDNIFESLKREGKTRRIVGHELFGEIAEAGSLVKEKFGYVKGDTVSAESHIICDKCYQCLRGEKHVCTNEIILGIGIDGVFAEYVMLPAKVLWKTDTKKIPPEIAAMQEPFGNAVHAATRVDVKGKVVGILGCGPIGLMDVLIIKALGASKILAVDPNDNKLALATSFGADCTYKTLRDPAPGYDVELVNKIHEATDGIGPDIILEMAGYHSSINTAIQTVRRGGDVILFGLKGGDAVIKNFDCAVIKKGVTLHSIIGRQVFQSWEITKKILEDTNNNVQKHLWEGLLKKGNGTIISFKDATTESFEESLLTHPKTIINYEK